MARSTTAPARRAHIVQATIACLAEHGPVGTTIARIAERAEVSRGIIHYYFASKESLIVAALEKIATDRVFDIERRARRAKGARASLRAVIAAALDQSPPRADYGRVRLALWSTGYKNPALRELTEQYYRCLRAMLARIISAGILEGSLRQGDVEQIATALAAMIEGLHLQAVICDDKADVEHFADAANEVVRGLWSE